MRQYLATVWHWGDIKREALFCFTLVRDSSSRITKNDKPYLIYSNIMTGKSNLLHTWKHEYARQKVGAKKCECL